MSKVELGQFFTKKDLWLKPQVKKFIKTSNCNIAYDPFAGNGDLLDVAKILGFSSCIGLDIDKNLSWKINDSLKTIPKIKNSIIITNPPYLAKQSATRKNLNLSKYFNNTNYDDIYLIALEKMIEASKCIVAIIPESFINSRFTQKNFLTSITILEENPFIDTECPVIVACFDGKYKNYDKIKIYKNNKYIDNLKNIENLRIFPKNDIKIKFNDKNGWLGLRAVDSTDDKTFIKFSYKNEIDYDFNHKIKVSSRHITLINLTIPDNKKDKLILLSNNYLNVLRKKSHDIILTPFMGNTKSGIRRRRLDYKLARAILEKSYKKIMEIEYEQFKFI